MSLAMAGFYIASFALLLTVAKVESAAYGESCTADTAGEKGDCTDPNGACSAATGGTCGCATNYVASAANACLLKAGQICTTDAECTTNSACSTGSPKKCTCSANYVQQPSGLCLKNAANSIMLSVLLLFAASVFSLTTTYLNNAL